MSIWFLKDYYSSVKTRNDLKAYDPALALLIAEVFGDNDWQSTSIQMRTRLPHLQGFNPRSAPQLIWPLGVQEAYAELYNPAIDERDEWVNLKPYDPSLLSRLNASKITGHATEILVVNSTGYEFLVYRVEPNGTETLFARMSRDIRDFNTHVGGLMLVKDSTGRNIAVFQAMEKTGRALVAPILHLIKPGLSRVSGDNQAGGSGSVLVNPFVVEVRDESLSVLEGIPVTFTVTAGDGMLNVTRTTTDENGRAEEYAHTGNRCRNSHCFCVCCWN